ncbi:MAG: hypothetical protein EPN79_03380 [Burkholderiaceae bacterium]|nr:MAG: hypothetical protein EPN79_03380 [Burkholderiaceae bacterium]TBR75644.1 MAG: hypothetical protein EPN64_11650 [Burkholderiaceae bacterium]
MDVIDKEFLLLKGINNSRRSDMLQPADVRAAARELMTRGRVGADEGGFYAADDVKAQSRLAGRPIGR